MKLPWPTTRVQDTKPYGVCRPQLVAGVKDFWGELKLPIGGFTVVP
jgi:hypothetical protein